MSFGTILLKLRNVKKLSQCAIAEQIGISQSTYNAWESDRSVPKATHLALLATVLGVDLRELIPQNLTVVIPPMGNSSQCPAVLNAHQLYEELTASQKQLIRLQQQRIEHLEDQNQQLRELLSNLKTGGGNSRKAINSISFPIRITRKPIGDP